MPAESCGAEHATARSALDPRRRSDRRPCRLDVTIRTPVGDCPALLLDLSEGGAGIRVDPVIRLRPGTPISITAPVLGDISCIVRWAIPPRYGAEFTVASHGLARVRSFYDTLAPAPGATI
jgi:hypothetical protein